MTLGSILRVLVPLSGLVALAACHGSGTPLNPNQSATVPAASPWTVIDAGSHQEAEGALGIYHFSLDPGSLQATVEPWTRTGQALGDTYAVDATDFFKAAPCGDCFKVDGVGLSGAGELFVDFKTRHPFALPTLPDPLPGERYDLHLFDVRSLFLFKPVEGVGTSSFVELASAGVADNRGPSELTIDNSGFLAGISRDGMTGAFDAYTDSFYPTDATLHPYTMLHTDTGPSNFRNDVNNGTSDIRVPTGHNVMPMGGGPYPRRVLFNAPSNGEPIEALILVIGQFGVSSQGKGSALGQRLNPVYFLPEFNAKAPWRVNVVEQSNTLQEGNTDSTAVVQAEIWDWQHAIGDSTLVANLTADLSTSRDSLLAPSRVTGVRAEVPGIAGTNDISGNYAGGDGGGASPLLWNLTIPNALDADEGSYLGLVEIIDEYVTPDGRADGMRQDGLTPFLMGRPSTYLPFTLAVAAPTVEPETGFGGGASMFNPSDPSLPKLAYGKDTYGAFAAQTTGNLNSVYAAVQGEDQSLLTGQKITVLSSVNWTSAWSTPFTITAGLLGNQENPAVAVSPDGLHVYLVYTHSTLLSEPDVYAQASHNMGVNWGSRVRVNPSDSLTQIRPSVAVTHTNRPIISWHAAGKSKVYFAASSNGGSSFPTQGGYATETLVRATQVVRAPNSKAPDGFTVVYTQDGSDDSPDCNVLCYPTGNTLWARIGVYNEPDGVRTASPQGGYLDDGTLLVTFTEGNTTAANSAVRVARKSWSSTSFDNPSTLSSQAGKVYEHPSLLARSDGKSLVAWNDNRDALTGHDIYVAASSNLGVSWSEPWREIGQEGPQQWPQLVLDPGNNRALLFWNDAGSADSALSLRCAAEPLDP